MRNIFVVLLLSAMLISCSSEQPNTVGVGVVLPLTGKMAKYGKTSQAALQVMVDVVNKRRQKNHLPIIDLIIEDDKMEAKEGVTALRKLIESDKTPAVIGAMASTITLAMAPIAETNKIVLISPGSSNPKVTNAGDYIFRTALSDAYEGKIAAVIYNKWYAPKRIAVLYINNDFGIGLRDVFKSNVSNQDQLLEFGYDEKATDFRTILSKISKSNCEVVYLIGYYEMLQIFKQAKEMGSNVSWIGTNQLNDQSLIDKIGNLANGTMFPAWPFDVDQIRSRNQQFYDEYLRISGGEELDIFAANAVDALIALDQAIDADKLTGEQIKSKLYRIQKFEGLTGDFSFDQNGDVGRGLETKIIQNRHILTLK